MPYLLIGVVALVVGLVAGFFAGKRASLWCPQCGGSSMSSADVAPASRPEWQ